MPSLFYLIYIFKVIFSVIGFNTSEMIKRFLRFFQFAILASFLVACHKDDVVEPAIIPINSVSLDKDEMTLTEGESSTLTVNIIPENATNKSVEWNSTDESVAKVDRTGKVTAIKEGRTTIKVLARNGELTAACSVTVIAKYYPVKELILDITEMTLTEGESSLLTATVLPDNATDKSVEWKSSDETVASVDQSGRVVAVKAGSATITVSAKDGGITAACHIEALNPDGWNVPGKNPGFDWDDDRY